MHIQNPEAGDTLFFSPVDVDCRVSAAFRFPEVFEIFGGLGVGGVGVLWNTMLAGFGRRSPRETPRREGFSQGSQLARYSA